MNLIANVQTNSKPQHVSQSDLNKRQLHQSLFRGNQLETLSESFSALPDVEATDEPGIRIDGLEYTINHSRKNATLTGRYWTNFTTLKMVSSISYKSETFWVTTIGYSAFFGGNWKEVKLYCPVLTIERQAFFACSSLSRLEINSTLLTIRSDAFYSCGSLYSAEINASELSIESSAFYNCGALYSAEINASELSIGSFAFYSCGALYSVKIRGFITKIESFAFDNCQNLSHFMVFNNSVPSCGGFIFPSNGKLANVTVTKCFKGQTFCRVQVQKILDEECDSDRTRINHFSDVQHNLIIGMVIFAQ